MRLPFSAQLQRSILASIERFVGLPATDLLAGTAPSYDTNPSRYMNRLAEALEYLRPRQAGLVTLVAGVGTVADTTVTANTIVFTQRKTHGGTVGVEYIYTASAGVGFTITSKAAAGSTETSDTSVLAYFVVEPAATVATPAFSVSTGTYANDQTVAITSATAGALFKYTLDGSTPSDTVGTVSGPTLIVNATANLKAVAYVPGMITSGVQSQTYTLVVATPTADAAAGSYGNNQTVTLATTTTGAQIRYTTDGSTPSATVGTLYSAPITVSASLTVKAIAYKTGYTNSAVLSAAYVLTAATPTASPAAGSYAGSRNIELFSTTTGASIYYTDDGSTPDNTDNLYNGVIVVAATKTIKAIAIKTGYTSSSVLSAAYTIS